jgi:hypothetical protein
MRSGNINFQKMGVPYGETEAQRGDRWQNFRQNQSAWLIIRMTAS